MRVVLFTDTLADVNGVSRFIRNAAASAIESGRDLHVVTATNLPGAPQADNITVLRPAAAMRMPKYENLELALPPPGILKLARSLRPDAVHVSTPGPVGCAGWLAARRLGVPLLGVYHTDFPAYIEHLFRHESMTFFCSAYMRRFYRPFSLVFTRSADYADRVASLGLPRDRIVPLRPGIRVEDFGPDRRMPGLLGDGGRVRALYFGRVSVEKNLQMLARAWRGVHARLGDHAELIVVGDGPYRAEMERASAGLGVRFLGFRYGEELSRLYASCDLFVFPSLTDTLGQVVLEAQASGLPVLVSDHGGPKEVVADGVTGLVVRGGEPEWVERIAGLVRDGERRRAMGREARRHAEGYSMHACFEHFWGEHERAVRLARAHGTRPYNAPVRS
jgi:glycosyltransferase involved in cell wall biosynthesis